MVGLYDLKELFQPNQFRDSVRQFLSALQVTNPCMLTMAMLHLFRPRSASVFKIKKGMSL